MKTLKTTLILLFLTVTTLFSATVDEQISAIVNAAPEDRVSLVNEFKVTLSTMNNDERAAAITQMRSTMNVASAQIKTQERSKNRLHQATQSEEMQRTQQMNQKQTVSQAMQQGHIGAASGTGTPNKYMGNK